MHFTSVISNDIPTLLSLHPLLPCRRFLVGRNRCSYFFRLSEPFVSIDEFAFDRRSRRRVARSRLSTRTTRSMIRNAVGIAPSLFALPIDNGSDEPFEFRYGRSVGSSAADDEVASDFGSSRPLSTLATRVSSDFDRPTPVSSQSVVCTIAFSAISNARQRTSSSARNSTSRIPKCRFNSFPKNSSSWLLSHVDDVAAMLLLLLLLLLLYR
mmetsp:Transcript_12200/g.23269  ORF Transcript_12200/g.23269 Transcript_12200/m.23269 type:complete len:211 (-) Transcript_12200:47-679(-)